MEYELIREMRQEAKELAGQSKIQKLLEGLVGVEEYCIENEGPDVEILKLKAWILIDLVKEYTNIRNRTSAIIHFNQLNSLRFSNDEVIENQKGFVRRMIEPNFHLVEQAKLMSKSGQYSEALASMKKLADEGKLGRVFHAEYGWVIYRYLKANSSGLNPLTTKRLLKTYLDLNNERPSILHSAILRFAIQYSKNRSDFDLYRFFLIWGPATFQYEDAEKIIINNKNIRSLITQLCQELIEGNYSFSIDNLLKEIKVGNQNLITNYESACKQTDLFRQPLFWRLYRLHSDGRSADFWKYLTAYTNDYTSKYPSKWHSEILSLATRAMTENETWRFFEFFKKWNPKLLQEKDWEDIIKEDRVYPSIARNACKKAFSHLQSHDEEDITWLIECYEEGVSKRPQDEWLQRELAILYKRDGQTQQSLNSYRQLALYLSKKYYFWIEFSEVIGDNDDLRMSMLAKALAVEKNDDFTGDARLEFANILHLKGLTVNAGAELYKYQKHREERQWKLPDKFDQLRKKIKITKGSNESKYTEWAAAAEEFAFQNIPWNKYALIERFRNKEGKEKLIFSDGKSINFAVETKFLGNSAPELGDIFLFRLNKDNRLDSPPNNSANTTKDQTTTKYLPLSVRPSSEPRWSILPDEFAIVDYINNAKKIVHAITFSNEYVFFFAEKAKFSINDLISAKRVVRMNKTESRTILYDVRKARNEDPILSLPTHLAVIDGVNPAKKLFHFVVNSKIDGVVLFKDTPIRPKIGDFIEVRLLWKKDKKTRRKRYKAITINPTSAVSDSLFRIATGEIELKYKCNGRTFDFWDLDFEDIQPDKPDFGFLGNFYIPKSILEKHHITSNCEARAYAVSTGEKWKVFKLEMIDPSTVEETTSGDTP